MQTKSITIINKLGLHARAAARFVQVASSFESDVNISHNGRKVNGKSIMGIMMLASTKGSEIQITTTGSDEVAALSELEQLMLDRFGEEE